MKGTPDSDYYAITITFAELPHNSTAKRQFIGTYKVVCTALEKSTDYELFPEWRMTNGTIHYHGTIAITDKIKWLKSTLPTLKKLGFINIKKVDDIMGWMEYTQKESRVANEILKPLVFPIKNGCIKHIKPEIIIENDEVKTIHKCICIECRLKALAPPPTQ